MGVGWGIRDPLQHELRIARHEEQSPVPVAGHDAVAGAKNVVSSGGRAFGQHDLINDTNSSIIVRIMKLTTFNLATLCMINRAPRSGYDIHKEFGSTPIGQFTDSPGAIYPALRKLEANGLITARIDRAGTLKPRRMFRLTAKGRRAIEERLRAPITRRDIIWHLDDLMIRFVYAEEILGFDASLEIARNFHREIKKFTLEFSTYVRDVSEGLSLMARLALENGIESYRQQLQWSVRAIRVLEKAQEEEAG